MYLVALSVSLLMVSKTENIHADEILIINIHMMC